MKITKDIIARLADNVKAELDDYVDDYVPLGIIQDAIKEEFIKILTEKYIDIL